jgi:hypothetical protein
MNEQPEGPPASPATSAELCLYLIMILPDQEDRKRWVKDFCRLYQIEERRPSSQAQQLAAESPDRLGRIFKGAP